MARIGIEWVKAYHGRANNLSNTQAQAEGFLNTLSGVRQFNWGDDLAWDQDFEQQGTGSGSTGTDSTWIDKVEAAFFSGHGSASGFLFGVAGKDDGKAKPSEIRWGDGALNWIAIDACQVLERDGVFDRWRPAFKGVHVICGFHTTTGDEGKRGRYFANHLNEGRTVRQAWIAAAQETEDSSTEWAYIRADADGTDTYNDHWFGKGAVSADPTTPTIYWYAKGAC